MRLRYLVSAAAIFCVVAAVAWLLYPIEVPARSFVAPLTIGDFEMAKREVLDSFGPDQGNGIGFKGGPSGDEPLEVSCKGVPMILVIWRDKSTSLMVFSGAVQRANPTFGALRRLEGYFPGLLAESLQELEFEPTGLEIFVAQFREGMDLRASCK